MTTKGSTEPEARMTQPKEYPNIAPGQCVYEDTCWKLFRQDAGMGETEYSLFRFDIFFCTCDQRKNADYILKLIHSRPHPAPARDFVDTPEKPWCYPGCMLVCNAKVEAARKAREKVLDDLDNKLRNPPQESKLTYESLSWVEAQIESLRSKEGGGS